MQQTKATENAMSIGRSVMPKQMCMADFQIYLSTYVTVINKNNHSIDIDLAAAIKTAQEIWLMMRHEIREKEHWAVEQMYKTSEFMKNKTEIRSLPFFGCVNDIHWMLHVERQNVL